MAILNFPQNPAVGDYATIGSTQYIYNGKAWVAIKNISWNSATGGSLIITTETNAVSVTTGGALTIKGGASIGKDLYIGGQIIGSGIFSGGTGIGSVSGDTATFKTIFATGGIDSFSSTTGDLIVTGGIGVGGNVFVGGVLFSDGAPVLTTASFNASLQDGADIDITDIGGGYIEINNISTLESTTLRGNSTPYPIKLTNTATSTSTTTGALIVTGGAGFGGRINSESLRITDTIFDSTVQITTSTIPTIIDQYSFGQFRSAKYLVQIDEGNLIGHRAQVTELLTLVSNSGTVIITEYGSVMTDGDLGNFDALVTNDLGDIVVKLYFIASDATAKTIKLLRTGMAK
jgi:hypothetical protein